MTFRSRIDAERRLLRDAAGAYFGHAAAYAAKSAKDAPLYSISPLPVDHCVGLFAADDSSTLLVSLRRR